METTGTACEVLDVVLFSAAGWRVGFEARHVRGLIRSPDASLCGRIEPLLCLPTPEASGEAGFALRLRTLDVAVLVDGPVEFVSLPATAVHPVPPLLAARTAMRALTALGLRDGEATLLLLFDAARFGHVVSGARGFSL